MKTILLSKKVMSSGIGPIVMIVVILHFLAGFGYLFYKMNGGGSDSKINKEDGESEEHDSNNKTV